jgi:hypothetical protein
MTDKQIPQPPRPPRDGCIWAYQNTTGQWSEIAIRSTVMLVQESDQNTVTAAAAAIVDIWMGNDRSWRTRINDSDFLESADWQMAVKLATAALDAKAQGFLRQDLIP